MNLLTPAGAGFLRRPASLSDNRTAPTKPTATRLTGTVTSPPDAGRAAMYVGWKGYLDGAGKPTLTLNYT